MRQLRLSAKCVSWPLGCLLVLAPWSLVSAADMEARDFTVLIDGKKAGEYHMAIRRQDDGHVVMNGQADVRVSYLVYKYTYSYQGTEVWKDGRLVRFLSNTNDNGKKLTVTAVTEGELLRVTANGQQRQSSRDVWLTTYWRLPSPQFRNKAVLLLDADTGKELAATLQYAGMSQLNIAGHPLNCAHYRVSGGAQADLWYDGQERLVRQESAEDGHKTILELALIRR